jgi:hypothetical protein
VEPLLSGKFPQVKVIFWKLDSSCTVQWSGQAALPIMLGVKCQMSPFQQTVLGHNGQGGDAIP